MADKGQSEAKRGRKAGTIYFPRNSLKDVLPIPKSIWEQNAGNPFDILDVAQAVDQSPTSGRFIQRLASSYRYGLTEGSPTTRVISLTPLGSSIVAPTADTDVNAQLRTALLNPPIFQKVYNWFDRKPIPRDDVLRNTLMKPPELSGFGIPKEDVDEFVRVFMENIEDYGLADDVQGTKYLRLDRLSPKAIEAVERPSAEMEAVTPSQPGYREIQPITGQSSTKPTATIPKQIFVAHGKNRRPVEQLERILIKFKVPH